MQPPHVRLSTSSRRSIFSIGPPVTPASNQAIINESTSAYLSIQDDEEERRQRQLSRLQHLQQSRSHGSPGADSTPGGKDKRRSVSGLEPRLTGQQLAMHYTKCIQLSAENKINIKNAFNLQLIDFMTDMLKRKDSDMNNFQVASFTLDASTKIYAYRVDSVHTDTMRMAGGLGRTQQEAGSGAGTEEDMQDGQPSKIKRKRTKKAATIETNPSSLNLSSLDLEFMVDPLFKKIASQFDEGKAGGGFFLNSLMLRDDGCQLLLDSEAVPGSSGAPAAAASSNTAYVTIPKLPGECLCGLGGCPCGLGECPCGLGECPCGLGECPYGLGECPCGLGECPCGLGGCPCVLDLSKKEICPPFSDFHFTSWKVGDDDSSFCDPTRLDRHDDRDELQHDHAFDINAVPEPLDDDGFGDQANFGSVDEVGEGDDDTVAATLGEGGNNTCLTVGWGGQHATSSASVNPSLGTVHLKEHLSTASQEYSYFDARVMSAWAGPGHWKFKPVSARGTVCVLCLPEVRFVCCVCQRYGLCAVSARDKDPSQPTQPGEKKRKKDTYELNFRLMSEVLAELDKQICPGRSDHKLSQNTIKKWCEANTTLPADLRFDPTEFSKLHFRDQMVVRRESSSLGATDGGHEDCPVLDQPMDDDDDEGCQENANTSGGGYDMTLFSQTLAPSMPASATTAQRDFCGDNLVTAPNKVSSV
ncbi:Condensin complex subunit 2/barren [Trinorchestia longiramus]|nr:Condensin complex subunit 2/barren [Trinorchestia longiramus]